jgi:hypothetical protein
MGPPITLSWAASGVMAATSGRGKRMLFIMASSYRLIRPVLQLVEYAYTGTVATVDKAVGLCAACLHVETICSDRGSIFYRCRLSARDPRFPKYPRLPVLSCPGYAGIPGIPDERKLV